MLNILERFDLKADGAQAPRTVHRITEAMRRAFFTRAERLGDPDFVAVPTDELISKAAADKLARSIGDRATPSAALAPFPVLPAESDHTTHFSTIDAAGNAVALTYTLEDSYGAKAVVAGAGFLLNNEMGDFNLIPGRTDTSGRIGTPANLIAPGKRMLSSMTPTIVLRNGKVRIVTGSPGGRTIPNTTLWVVLNVLEFGLDPRGRGRSANPSPVVSRRAACSRVNPGRKRCVPSWQPWATTGGQSIAWESPTRSSSILQPARSMALPIVAARLQRLPVIDLAA